MPRRPRPASRALPKSLRELHKTTTSPRTTGNKKNVVSMPKTEELQSSDPEESENTSNEMGSESSGGAQDTSENSEDSEDTDIDAPRLAQWVDEDELGVSSDDDDEDEASHVDATKIQDDLSSLPLGVLRKAQHALRHAGVDSEDESGTESDQSSDLGEDKSAVFKGKPEWSLKPKADIPKRQNKHAPVEMSSKRPVTRRRQVVEVKTYQPRDPRFLNLSGELSVEKFHNSYGFLIEARRNELSTLKDDLKRARRMSLSAPQDKRGELASEVKRLELAVQRTESLVNKDKREKVEMEALHKATQEEREKRKQGKGDWWMKKGEKKKVVMEARYRALAEEGGQRAIKKAIEKKQKRIGQREKRKRPVIRDQNSDKRKRRKIQ